jgi:hypothetical protein
MNTEEIQELMEVLIQMRDAVDQLMGDTDLEDDDTPEFRAMRRANEVLEKYGH